MPTTIIPTLSRPRSRQDAANSHVRQPHFECADLPQALKLDVYIPGVDASDVEITTRGPDLVVHARKAHHVRVNWQALHLESAQRDYELKLRLGLGLDFDSLAADLRDGVLRVVVPKKNSSTVTMSTRRVA